MIDRQHVPLIVFAACIVLAGAVAFLTGEWTTALAIALSGCALALAMRQPQPENHDTAFLEEDLAELRGASEAQGADIAILRGSIDEMAEIVESIATDLQRLPDRSQDGAAVEALRGEIAGFDKRIAAFDAPIARTAARLDSLERGLASVRQDAVRSEETAEIRPVALAASGTGGAARASGGSLLERAARLREGPDRGGEVHRIATVPLFDAGHAPRGQLVEDTADTPTEAGSLAALGHALGLAEATDGDGGDIFLRLPQAIVAAPDFADAVERVLAGREGAAARIVAVIPQAALDGHLPAALSRLLDAGARFALERMTDWSVDLAALARRGLAVIAVDGPAMAKSALSQKGDPTRLRQVLHARGIALLAAGVDTRMQLDAVGTLEPDLLAGPGLGEADIAEIRQ